MRDAKLTRAFNARALPAAALCLLFTAAWASASAQTQTNAPAPAQPAQQSGPTADEDFELNIVTRRISEGDFQAETAVEAGGASGLRLKVGAALRASDIEVLLTGVRGRVRFRGNLAPLLRLLDARRGPASGPESQTPPAPAP